MQNAAAGGTGWAGSAVVDALHTYGDEPVVLAGPTGVRPKSDAEWGLPASPIAVLPADRVALEVEVLGSVAPYDKKIRVVHELAAQRRRHTDEPSSTRQDPRARRVSPALREPPAQPDRCAPMSSRAASNRSLRRS